MNAGRQPQPASSRPDHPALDPNKPDGLACACVAEIDERFWRRLQGVGSPAIGNVAGSSHDRLTRVSAILEGVFSAVGGCAD